MNSLEKHKSFLIGIPVLAVLMLVCAGFTSPLYPHYIGLDSSMFLITAKGLLSGKIAYVDLFDHKGPVFFWIEALGYALGGRTGVWLLQCMFAVADLFLIKKICGLFRANFLYVAFAFFAVFFCLFSHGNLTEEFSMPLILLGLYYELRFLTSDQKAHPPLWALLYGLLIGAMAFIRVNNSVILCALILCIAIILIRNREWKNLLLNLAAGIVGIAVVAIPVCLYFAHYGALDDMLYATFLHNLIYAKNNTHDPIFSKRILHFAVMYLPGIFALLVFGKRWCATKRRVYLSLITAVCITYLMLLYSNIYDHYFMLGLPLFMVAAAVLLEENNQNCSIGEMFRFLKSKLRSSDGKVQKLFVVLAATVGIYLVLSAYSACAPIYKTYLTDTAYDQYRQIHESTEQIPEDERDSVIGFGVLADFYVHADIVPCYKYYTLQRWMTTDENDVYGQFMDYVQSERPLWLVTKPDEDDSGIKAVLDDSYTFVTEDDYACYYRLNQ